MNRKDKQHHEAVTCQFSRIEIRISDELLDQIDACANKCGMSRSAWIKEACRDKINETEAS